MSNELNNIDNLFKAGLGSYTEVPPPDVWDALEQRLDNEKKKRPFAWRWVFVTVALVMVVGSLLAWRLTGNDTEIFDATRDGNSFASVQQNNASSSVPAAGNTSAAQQTSASTNTITHKKHNNKETNYTTSASQENNDPETGITPAPAPATPSAGNFIDKSAMAMAETGTNPARGGNTAKDAAIQHIINNKRQNNIAVTETGEDRFTSAPAVATYATIDEEEEVTYGHRSNAAAEKHILNEDDNLVVAAPVRPRVAKTTTGNSGYAANARIGGTPTATGSPVVTNRYAASATGSRSSGTKTTPAAAKTNTTVTDAGTKTTTAVRITTPITNGAVATTATKPKKNSNPAATTPAAVTTVGTTNQPAAATTAPAAVATTNSGVAASKPAVTPSKVAATTTPAGSTVAAVAKPAPATTPRKTTATVARTKPARTPHRSVAPTNAMPVAAAVPAKHTGAVDQKIATTTTPAAPTTSAVTKTVKKRNVAAARTNIVAAAPTATTNRGKQGRRANTVKPAATTPVADVADNETPVAAAKTTRNRAAKVTQPAVATTKTSGSRRNAKNNIPEPTATKITWNTSYDLSQEREMPVLLAAAPTPIPGTFKPEAQAKPTDPAAAAASTDSSSKSRHHYGFTYGVKGGFEGGFGNSNSNKFVIAPYIERQLSSKLSVMAQPAIKFARARSNALSGTQTYYQADPNGSITTIDSVLVPVIQNNQTTGYLVRINLAYSQKFDSIVKSYATGGNYVEFELPIMLKYSFNDKLSVYGGVTLNYSKYVAIKEHTMTIRDLTKYDTSFTIYPAGPQPFSSVMNYNGNNINAYSGPLYPTQTGGLFRMGYMLGFSYQLQKRWMVDMLVQQGRAKANVQGGYDVNKPLSTPYFRLTLGYRLSK